MGNSVVIITYQTEPGEVDAYAGLATQRTPPDELVVAPSATAMALLGAPHRATLNLAALQAAGARGNLGFIEALDFTPAAVRDGPVQGPMGPSRMLLSKPVIAAVSGAAVAGGATQGCHRINQSLRTLAQFDRWIRVQLCSCPHSRASVL